LGLLCLTKYIESIVFGAEPGGLCSIVDFRGSLAALILVLRPRPPPHPRRLSSPSSPSSSILALLIVFLPVLFVIFLPVLFVVLLCPLRRRHPPRLVVVGLNSRSWGSFIRRGSCYPVVVLSGIVLSWWSRCGGVLLRRLYCRGGSWVVVVVVGLSWLGCRCRIWVVLVVVVVAPSSSWLRCRRGVVALVMHALGLAARHSTRLALPRRCVIHSWGFAVEVRHAGVVLHSRRGGGYAGGGCCVNLMGISDGLRMDGWEKMNHDFHRDSFS